MAEAGTFGVAERWRDGVVILCVVLVGIGTGVGVAQEDKTPTLHAYSNLVQVPTLVLDRDRKPIVPIAEGKFFVSIDGGPKFRVTHARLEGEDAISLGILLDASQPFPGLMRKIDDAIAGLAPVALHPKDHVSLYALDCHLSVSAADVPADSATLKTAVDAALQTWSSGEDKRRHDCKKPWNLWDSLAAVTQRVAAGPGRRVVLVVTDGLDRGSKTHWEILRDYAQGKGVAIFGLVQPVDMNGMIRGQPGQDNFLTALCEATGGMVLTSSPKDIAQQLTWFTTLLRERYIIEFPKPVDTMGGRRDMDISVDKMSAFIRPAGISVPLDDPAILNDPLTISSDPSHAPQLGKKKVAAGK